MSNSAELLDGAASDVVGTIPFAEDILTPVESFRELGVLACIYATDSWNDDEDHGLGSGNNDDALATGIEYVAPGETPDSIINLN